MAWLLAASVTVTFLSAGTVTAYAQEEMPLAEAGTVTESAEEGNIEAKEKGELPAPEVPDLASMIMVFGSMRPSFNSG